MRDELELDIYDVIGGDWFGEGVTAKSIKALLDKAGDVRRIVLRINSPGGSALDGVAIYNLLKQHKAPVKVYVDGIAASAASLVAMAGDEIVMGEGAFLMIHNAGGFVVGTSDDMLAMAEILQKLDGEYVKIYAKRAGIGADEARALQDAETWMTAEEAIAAGFADRMAGEGESAKKTQPEASARARLFAYKNIPESLRAIFEKQESGAVKPPAGQTVQDKETPMPDQEKPAEGRETEEAGAVEERPVAEAAGTEAAPEPTADVQATVDAAIAGERERVNAITAKARELNLVALGEKLSRDGVAAAAAIDQLKDAAIKAFQASGAPPVGPDAEQAGAPKGPGAALNAKALELQAKTPGLSYRDALLKASE